MLFLSEVSLQSIENEGWTLAKFVVDLRQHRVGHSTYRLPSPLKFRVVFPIRERRDRF
jgi:hypothetical protein